MLEGGFVDLMKYDSKKDELIVSDDLLNGESEILKLIAANIPDFAGDWDAMWGNIELRAKIKEAQVKYAVQANDLDILEAPFTIRSNDTFHLLSEKCKKEVGSMDSKRIFTDWDIWAKREIKKWQKGEKGKTE